MPGSRPEFVHEAEATSKEEEHMADHAQPRAHPEQSRDATRAGPAKPRWLNRDEQRTWRTFMLATRLLFEQLDRELQREASIPASYYEVLVRLSEAPGWALRMSELADCSQTSRSRLSHAVAKLERLGWVRRESCSTDRRGAYAVLTQSGFDALEAAAPAHVEGVRQHLFDLLDEEDLNHLRSIGETLLDHLISIGEASAEYLGSLADGLDPCGSDGDVTERAR